MIKCGPKNYFHFFSLENALAAAIDHLAVCRRLSKGQAWQFKPKVLTIKLMKPIALHGLRFAGMYVCNKNINVTCFLLLILVFLTVIYRGRNL